MFCRFGPQAERIASTELFSRKILKLTVLLAFFEFGTGISTRPPKREWKDCRIFVYSRTRPLVLHSEEPLRRRLNSGANGSFVDLINSE